MNNKNARLALATLFLNFSVAAHQEPLQEGLSDAFQQLTALYAEVLGALGGVPDDVVYRYFVGLGTLLKVRKSVFFCFFVVGAKQKRGGFGVPELTHTRGQSMYTLSSHIAEYGSTG